MPNNHSIPPCCSDKGKQIVRRPRDANINAYIKLPVIYWLIDQHLSIKPYAITIIAIAGVLESQTFSREWPGSTV
jgi:hypothetical protein